MSKALRMAFKPSTINDEARTVELVASTGAGVMRADYDGAFVEMLEISPQAVDLSRLDGMPLLDSHRQDGLDRVLGVVRAARFDGARLIVTVQFSTRAEAIWSDVKAGIISNVSIGYAPVKYRDGTNAEGARVRTVTLWELREVSLVPVGADPTAKVRKLPMEEDEITLPAPKVETRATVNQEIRALAQVNGFGASWADAQIDRGATVDQARSAAQDALLAMNSRRPTITASVGAVGLHDDPTQFRSLAGEAIYATRANPAHQLSEPARSFANMTTLDLARECCRRAGIVTVGMSVGDTFKRALTTSDFPAIFADTANRSLRARYGTVPGVLKRLAHQATAKDFRAKTKLQSADLAKLEKVGERGEYRHSGLIEGKESYKIGRYGTIVSLSGVMLVNDDIGAFADMAARLGEAAGEFENQFLVDLLVTAAGAGPAMDDGKAVFHADHANISAAGALSSTTLSAARLAMRRQTGINGRFIPVTPKYLLVPPELETQGETILAAIQPTKTEDVNPFGGKLDLLVEPRLTDARRWYVVGDPALIEGLEYSYLQGAEGPQTESRQGFETDGVDVKVRLDFGAAFLDWRGWHTNAGA